MATTLQGILPSIDAARQTVQNLGFRLTRVILRVRTWTGATIGVGTFTDVDTEIIPRPRVRQQIAGKDAYMPLNQNYTNAGLIYEGQLKVDRITTTITVAQLESAPSENQRGYVILQGADGGEVASTMFIIDGAPVRETTQWSIMLLKVEG